MNTIIAQRGSTGPTGSGNKAKTGTKAAKAKTGKKQKKSATTRRARKS